MIYKLFSLHSLALIIFSLFEVASLSYADEDYTDLQFDYGLDAYYSHASLTKSFADKKPQVVPKLDELNLYKTLFEGSLTPDFIVFEASLNPLPTLGAYIRRNMPNLYNQQRFRPLGSNLIETMTTGFEEPFAISVFVGRVIHFETEDNSKENKGFIGYLVSAGSWHLLHNQFIRDNWYELEWKFKGIRETEAQHLSWSFRVGAKFHQHPDISNTLMLGLHRDRVDFMTTDDSFLRNIGIDYRLDILQKNFALSQQELILDKHWVLSEQYVVSLGLGALWQNSNRYTGTLANQQAPWVIIFRPNILF